VLGAHARVQIELACTQLLDAYVIAIDAMDWSALDHIFAPDAAFQRTNMVPLRGCSQIKDFFQTLAAKRLALGTAHRTCHQLTTTLIMPTDPLHATGVAYVMVMRTPNLHSLPAPMTDPEILIEYHDTFRATEDGWRISDHSAHHIFRSAAFREPLTAAEAARLKPAV
jgi:hypothetical protein